ncbi:C2 calcium-dependent domain-containing protein 4C-like [Pogona vitticeps]
MWFLEKMRAAPGEAGPLSPLSLGSPPAADKAGSPGAAFANVLTPDRIPEFCIPPRLASPAPAKSPGSAFLPHRCLTEPGLQCAAHGPPGLVLPHLIQVESVEESSGAERGGGGGGEGDGGTTNADPQSQAALSLPHVPKAQTSYGFCTLLESPHTRRKESIFHRDAPGGGGSSPLPGSRRPRSRASSYSCGRELAPSPPGASPSFPARQGAWDSDTTASSAESSPFGSPLLGRLPPRPAGSLFKARSQDGLLGQRRLPGRTGSGGPMARAHSLSAEEGSSTDSSPNSVRRSSESLFDASSRAYSLSPLPIFPLDLPCGVGRERLGHESTVPMDKGGLLRLSSEYCPENRRLRIRLISVEGLYGGASSSSSSSSSEPKNINCCITFSLLPGKLQKQRSTVIKRSRNPIFNEDFFFLGISEDDLYSLSVRMKAVNKGCSMKRDLVLGESHVDLMTLLAP